MNPEMNGPETTAARCCSLCTSSSGNWFVTHARAPARVSMTSHESTHRSTRAQFDPEAAHRLRRRDHATAPANVSDELRVASQHPLSRVRRSGKRRDSLSVRHLSPSTSSETRQSLPSNRARLHPTAPADTRRVSSQPRLARSTASLRVRCASGNRQANQIAHHEKDSFPSPDTIASTRDKYCRSQNGPATVFWVSQALDRDCSSIARVCESGPTTKHQLPVTFRPSTFQASPCREKNRDCESRRQRKDVHHQAPSRVAGATRSRAGSSPPCRSPSAASSAMESKSGLAIDSSTCAAATPE